MDSGNFPAPLLEILECSICLETYTRPRTLPCEHTFCYACLLRVTGNENSVICPECREEHKLPPQGIKGFSGSRFMNNLLALLPVEDELNCADCQQQAHPLSLCDHCKEKVCFECRVEHTALSRELEIHLNTLKESVMSQSYRKKFRGKEIDPEECLQRIEIEQERTKQAFARETRRLVESLTKRGRYFEQYFSMVSGIYRDLLRDTDETGEAPSFVTDLSDKLLQCKTIKSLQQLKNELSNVKNVTRLVKSRDDEFKFTSESLTLGVDEFGRVEFGQAVVGIHGEYDDGPGENQGIQSHRSEFSFSTHESGQKTTKNVETWTDFPKELSVASGSVMNEPATMRDAWTLTEERYTSLPGAVSGAESRDPLPAPYLQNLPKNVDYKIKCQGQVVVIGQDNVDSGMRLECPFNLAYHVTRDELYVVQHYNACITVYNTRGGNGRVFYTVDRPRDVTISDDGEHIYIVEHNSLHKVSINGQLVKTIDSFPLGKLTNCSSLVFYNRHVAVLSRDHKCVIIYTESCEYVRHFCLENILDVWSMAVDGLGNFYIPDVKTGSVNVYTWHGQFTVKFGELGIDGDSRGICVDGDGVVCVSRWYKHRIDVYDPQRRHLTSLGKPGIAVGDFYGPYGLCLLPDGRLVVADFANHRLQIL